MVYIYSLYIYSMVVIIDLILIILRLKTKCVFCSVITNSRIIDDRGIIR